MQKWLAKTEPEEFSYEDLERKGREPWTGVRNPTALKHMRAMQRGDLVLIYHTGGVKAMVGVAEVVTEAYPDPTAEDPRFVAVDVEPRYRFVRPVSLSEVKANPVFAAWELVRQSRLSVMPVSEEHWGLLHQLGATAEQ